MGCICGPLLAGTAPQATPALPAPRDTGCLQAAAPARLLRQSQLHCVKLKWEMLTVATRHSTVSGSGHSGFICIRRRGRFVAGCQQRTAYLEPPYSSGAGQAAASWPVPEEPNNPVFLPVACRLTKQVIHATAFLLLPKPTGRTSSSTK